ncbi:MAG TPA: hypothetical protein VFY28_01695 [Candidatus Paceibacterota bacterium]|nr:hypothetical protein [Candidatus Paceibacterota bacterium]
MIEVEIRGRLTDTAAEELGAFLEREGTLVEVQDREMILLRGYPGYAHDPNMRDMDIRLRNTNGKCEIMVKRKTSEHNVARHEVSLPLGCPNLDLAKEVVKSLGYDQGIWMHRQKKVYQYRNIEWSIVTVPQGLSYYEAEQEAEDASDVERIRACLTKEAGALGLGSLNPEGMREFIYELDATVNKEITW